MKRYKVIILVPTVNEILAVDSQSAHVEATSLAKIGQLQEGQPAAIVHSVELMFDEPDPVEYGFNNET